MTYFDHESSSRPAATENPDAVTRLAARMAHELNNPLDAVLRFVSLAQRKARAGDYSDIDRYLSDAQFGLQRMTEILRELMDIGRRAEGILAKPQPLPVPDLVAHAIRTTAALAEQKSVSVTFDNQLPANTAPRFELRLSQVIANLLKNAIEASSENAPVSVMASISGNRILITVQDSGPGIADALKPDLFVPFTTTKPNGAGHGLGLTISRELLIPLGGSLSIENRPGPNVGCIATISLPLRS
jgi:signal transduction histidine kinase